MVLTDKVKLYRKGNNKINYYSDLGYNVNDEYFLVEVKDLTKGSRLKINVSCDECNIEKEVIYKDYNRFNTFPHYTCSNCKREKTNLEKYGETHTGKVSEFKEKSRKTNLEKYGVDHPLKSKVILDKIKSTNLERLGVENPFQSEKVKECIKLSNLDKYGVDHYSKTSEYVEKVKSTNLKNWGVDSYTKTKEYLERVKETNLYKYGYDNPNKSPVIKEKIKKTFYKKWGGFTFCSEDLLDKVRKTNLDKYGVDHYSKTTEYIQKVKETNLDKYGVDHPSKYELYRNTFKITNDINYIRYLNNGISLFNCDVKKGHQFKISAGNYSDRKRNNISLCTVCNPIGDSKSIKEKELYEFISSIYAKEVIQSYRDGLEIDIYLPELKIGFEFNGLYWHSDKYKDKWYHIDKTKYFKERGIRIIHIWEDDWDNRREIIKSQINNWIGLTKNRIFARKCYVKEIHDSKIATKFLENNHIQGKVGSSLKLGLYYNDELVSLMTFDKNEGRKIMEPGGWNINRFCNKINYSVVGGASKLLKYFITNYDVKRILSYADRDWSESGLYEILGFSRVSESKPDYKYLVKDKRIHKSSFRKSKTGISETKLDIYKIWDCGKVKYEINI